MEGRFRLKVPVRGPVQLYATAVGWSPASTLAQPGSTDVELVLKPQPEGQPAAVEVRRAPGVATVTGRISGLSAAELTRIQVNALTADPGRLRLESLRGTTDGRGVFRIEHLAPGIWKVAAGLDDGRFAAGNVTIAPGQTAAVLDLTVLATAPVQVCTPAPKGGGLH